MGPRPVSAAAWCCVFLLLAAATGAAIASEIKVTEPDRDVTSSSSSSSTTFAAAWTRRLQLSKRGSPAREVDDYHYIFSADCKPYMDWQSVALYYSWVGEALTPGCQIDYTEPSWLRGARSRVLRGAVSNTPPMSVKTQSKRRRAAEGDACWTIPEKDEGVRSGIDR
jgi:hypothetical protein